MIQSIESVSRADPSFYLLDQIDRRLQIHAEIDESPRDTFTLVLFLFEHEHVVVEVLLQLLVGEVDAELFEAVVLRCVRSCTTMHTGTQREKERKRAKEKETEREKTMKKSGRACARSAGHHPCPVGWSFDLLIGTSRSVIKGGIQNYLSKSIRENSLRNLYYR